jgi:AtzE family amidohydrolase
MTPHELSAGQIAELVRGRKMSAAEICAAHIARIERFDPALNCFTDATFARAKAEAAAIDRRLAAGEDPGPLAGVPVAVKNLYDVRGLVTRAGSKILAGGAPAAADAPALARLTAAGAVLLGATNMDEFAYGFVTENAHDGTTRNPHDPARIAGGSSGGSAAAVAAGFAPVTLGTDTNGSIRLPAGLCGVFGLKPTYGRIERTGTYPFVDSFDHLGPFARSAADLSLVYDLIQDSDPPSAPPEPSALRVGVLDEFFTPDAPEIAAAVAAVAAGLGGATVVTLPDARRARAAAFCITAFEGGQLHKANLAARPQDFDPATRPRLMAGALLPAEFIYQAQRFRAWFRAQVQSLFERFDLLLAPASPCVAPLIGQTTMTLNGAQVAVRPNLGVYTQPISFIGLPVVCVPVTGGGRLPRGVQLIAAPGRERLALAAAARLARDGVVAAPVAALA